LADTIENAADKLGISSNFLATIVLPILGNAAEHASAIIFGYKGKATLAMAIAIGSSIQIALFVFPLLIVLGWMIGLDVDFDMGNFEAITLLVASILPNLILTVARSSYTDGDNKVMLGETHYFSGVILVAAYFMIAVGFYARNEESLDT
jgi:Ca2+:H+ antiporter